MLKIRRKRNRNPDLPDESPTSGTPPTIRVRLPRPQWRWIPFLVSHVMAIGLLASWCWPATRRVWDLYDAGVFHALNATLALGDWWAWALAVANCRTFDLVAAAGIGVLLLWNVRFYEKRCLFSGWFSLALLAATLFLAKTFVCGTIIHDLVGLHRGSPTTVVQNCYRVTELVPAVNAKDSSPWSFPGDHGFILISVALYIVYRGSGRQEMLAWLFVVVFGLPRIFVGAHWATDLAVGSAAVSLVVTAWLLATPLHDRLVNRACWGLAELLGGLFQRRQPAGAQV